MQGILRAELVLASVFADTADAVAAHLGLAAIGIEDAHAKVVPAPGNGTRSRRKSGGITGGISGGVPGGVPGGISGGDEDEAVRADAIMAVGHAAGEFRQGRFINRLFSGVDDEVVVAQAVHFGEGNHR